MTKVNLKPKMLQALKMSNGAVYASAEKVGISAQTHYEWMKEDEAYRKAVEDINELAIDHVESKLQDLINDGDTTATIFFLKTKGKKRGYVETERKEIAGNVDVNSNLEINKLPKELLYQVADKLQGIDNE